MNPPGSWWGRAWIDALEHRARLGNRLPRGRSYAQRGLVDDLRVEPGRIRATVRGTRAQPYATTVAVRTFDAAQWDAILARLVERAGLVAALVDGDLPHEIAEDLLPGPGDLAFTCSCPDEADPCKHAAAVCYVAARTLDEEPFALLHLRGRTRDEVLDAVRHARTEHREADVATLPARSLVGREPGPLPAPLPAPDHPGSVAHLLAAGLADLAADAARRAHAVLTQGEPSGLALDRRADLARRAAACDDDELTALARRSDIRPERLEQLASAWELAGPIGLLVVDEPQPTDPEALEPARAAIADLGPRARARVRADGVYTSTGVVLRLGPDRRWYRLERRARTWDLVAPPADDPADLLTPSDLPPLRDRLTPPPRIR